MSNNSLKPGPEATNWENDYRLYRTWLRIALEVWDAIPIEFRGNPQQPHTLVEKVRLMVATIKQTRFERDQLCAELDAYNELEKMRLLKSK